MQRDIRWKQRFTNFEKAFIFLQKGTQRTEFDELQAVGIAGKLEKSLSRL